MTASALLRRARFARADWAAVPAVAVLLAVGAVVSAGPAAASRSWPLATGQARLAANGGSPGAGNQATSGMISTLAGGPGGPENGTNVALQPCGVTYGGGHLYISEPGPKPGVVHTIVPGDRYHADAVSKPVSSGAVQRMR